MFKNSYKSGDQSLGVTLRTTIASSSPHCSCIQGSDCRKEEQTPPKIFTKKGLNIWNRKLFQTKVRA